MEKVKYYTCICGKKHVISDQPVVCDGPGHRVVIQPRYWTYDINPKPAEPIPQLSLF